MSDSPKKLLEKHYRIGQAAEILGLTPINIRIHIKTGEIRAVRTPGGMWRIPESELLRWTGHTPEEIAVSTQSGVRVGVIYARVSSQKQADTGNLDRQVQRLQEYAQQHQLTISESVTDVGSGLKEKRKGLARVLRLAREQRINYVLVECRDRLTRFGYQYVSDYLTTLGVKVIVKETALPTTPAENDLNKELIEDLIAIIYSFSGKLYGRRSAKFRQLKKCVTQTLHEDE